MSKTVLIADDSASMRLSVRMLLEGRHIGFRVREAIDGVDAIEKAKTLRPDLILLDLAMPRLNGAEAAAVLKNDMPETPVILFTLTDLPIDSLCAAIGVDFISKADGVSKLLEWVDALLPPTPRTKEQLFGRHPNNVEFLRSRLRKMSIHHPPHTISARNGLYLHFEGSEMADTYRITSHGPNFIINHDAGMTVGVYGTQQEALREIEACEQDDFMLETARSLVKNAVDVLVQTHNIDRRAACGWIREAAG